MTIQQLQLLFKDKLDYLDLELIIADSIKKSREFVLAHPEYQIPSFKIKNLKIKIARRRRGEPLAYILGRKEFFGLDFIVDKNVLIPRPETEQIVELVLKKLSTINHKPKTIIDAGTGSGNIIISLAKNIENLEFKIYNLKFFAVDISEKALRIAKKNSRKNKVEKKIKFIHGNLLEPILQNKKYKLEKNIFITSNLPYLNGEWKKLLKNKESAGLKFEPALALYGGKDGLDFYRKLAGQIKILKDKNNTIHLFCEIDDSQKNEMENIFSFAKKIDFRKDLAGKWRILEVEI